MSGFGSSGKLPRSWQAPPATADEGLKLGWLDDATGEGLNWQKSQRVSDVWNSVLQVISGVDDPDDPIPEYCSVVSSHRMKTNIRVLIAGLSNIKPIWGWHAPDAYADYAKMINRTGRALYLAGHWDQTVKRALQWALTGTGFVRPVYRRRMAGHGSGFIDLPVYGLPSVAPVQMPADGDWNNSYAITWLEELPIWMAHGMFPFHQDKLKPTKSMYWYSSQIWQASVQNAAFNQSWFGRGGDAAKTEYYCPIRYTRLNDLSINQTGRTQPMGQLGSSWYYEVPAYGQPIVGQDGQPIMVDGRPKLADENDARLYPRGRMMISSEKCVMYDGPSFNWCPDWDGIPFQLDSWPWEPGGLSPILDGAELEKSLNRIDRGCDDKVRTDLDRTLCYNLEMFVTKKDAEKFDPRRGGERLGVDVSAGEKPFFEPVGENYYQIHEGVFKQRQVLEGALDYLFQTREMVELAKARGLGRGMDNIEAFLAASGPLVRDLCRSMESPLSEIGRQVGYLVYQYMDTSKLLMINGEEGVPLHVFDYDPNSVVPSHMPDEIPADPSAPPTPSRYSRMERARWFIDSVLQFAMVPHSSHEILQMSQILLMLQLKGRGAPVSWATIMAASEGVPDVKIPEGVSEQERSREEQKEELLFAMELKKIIEGAGGNLDQFLAAMKGGGGKKGGRKPSGGASPQMQSKDGGARNTVAESR